MKLTQREGEENISALPPSTKKTEDCESAAPEIGLKPAAERGTDLPSKLKESAPFLAEEALRLTSSMIKAAIFSSMKQKNVTDIINDCAAENTDKKKPVEMTENSEHQQPF
jgi:hypothetical protein